MREAKLRPYRLTIHHQLTEADKQRRVEMAQWMEDNPEVLDKVWFSDEAHFWLCGHVNSHNAVHWGEERPNEVLHKPLHSKKITVWAAMRKDQPLVGPFFFEDEEEEPITITAERYVTLALTPFLQAIQRIPGFEAEQHWLQQDGATPHTARLTLAWLRQHFAGQLISLKTEVPWAPHSPDLSPLDFMLWGYLKSLVYADKPATVQQLKAAIRTEMERLPVDMINRTIRHLQQVRLPQVVANRGGHFEHIL